MTKQTDKSSADTNVVPLNVPKPPKVKKRRAEDKFSDPVMKHGYTMLPNLLLKAQGRLKISHAQFNVLVQIISHWWDADEDPYPTKETIARRMGKSPRQIQRYLTELETAGFIKRVERFSGKKAQVANGYSLEGLVEKLKEIEPAFKKEAEQKKIRQRKVETGSA